MLVEKFSQNHLYLESYQNAKALVGQELATLGPNSLFNFSFEYFAALFDWLDAIAAQMAIVESEEDAYLLGICPYVFALGVIERVRSGARCPEDILAKWSQGFIYRIFEEYGAAPIRVDGRNSPIDRLRTSAVEYAANPASWDARYRLPEAKILLEESHVQAIFMVILWATTLTSPDNTELYLDRHDGIPIFKLAAAFSLAVIVNTDSRWVDTSFDPALCQSRAYLLYMLSYFIRQVSLEGHYVLVVFRFSEIDLGGELVATVMENMTGWLDVRRPLLESISLSSPRVLRDFQPDAERNGQFSAENVKRLLFPAAASGIATGSASKTLLTADQDGILHPIHRQFLAESYVGSFDAFGSAESRVLLAILEQYIRDTSVIREYGEMIRDVEVPLERALLWIRHLESKSLADPYQVEPTVIAHHMLTAIEANAISPLYHRTWLWLLSYYERRLAPEAGLFGRLKANHSVPSFYSSIVESDSDTVSDEFLARWAETPQDLLIQQVQSITRDTAQTIIERDKQELVARCARSICAISNRGMVVGTGVLIAPTLVLTSKHVLKLHHIRASGETWPEFLNFHFPSDANAQPLNGQNWLAYDPSEIDLAIVRLNNALPADIVRPAELIPTAQTMMAESVFALHYPAFEGATASLHRYNMHISFLRSIVTALDIVTHSIYYTTATLQCSSGAPIFDWEGRVRAIHRGGRRRSGEDVKIVGNRGTVFTNRLYKDIQGIIADG